MNILVISTDTNAGRHFDSLCIADDPAGRVTLFDPALDEMVDVRPFDIIALDTRNSFQASVLDDKLWPADEVKPVLRLDFERLAMHTAGAAASVTATAETAAPYHS